MESEQAKAPEPPGEEPKTTTAGPRRWEQVWALVGHAAGAGLAFAARVGWKKPLALALVGAATWSLVRHPPVVELGPGEAGLRVNELTGHVAPLHEGLNFVVPFVQRLRRLSLRDRIYQPAESAHADGPEPFQSAEGLNVGVEVTLRYAIDPERIVAVGTRLPDDVDGEFVEPLVKGVLHRVFATHTVREIFSTERAQIQKEIESALGPALASDGVVLRSVFIGNVDLPASYRQGLEALLAEELAAEKMKYTLALKDEEVKQTALEGDAEKVRREKAAEAAAREEVIAAQAKEEAMKHVLPFREKEVEERKLEADAAKVARVEGAEAEAEARRVESQGEADARRKLADADAYRTDVMGKAESAQLAREGALISRHPLLIQKTLADKLSDKISVIIAPPNTQGFVAANVLGTPPAAAAPAAPAPPAPAASDATADDAAGDAP